MLYNLVRISTLLIISCQTTIIRTQSCHGSFTTFQPGVQVLCNGFDGLLRFNAEHLRNINKLSFSKNEITSIDASSFNAHMSSVETLLLDNNKLTNVNPTSFKNLPNLKEIDLSYNRIKTLNSESFSSNKYLRAINLTGNNITLLHTNVINKLEHLKQFILSNNSIDVCNNETVETLRYLEQRKIETYFSQTCEELIKTKNDDSTSLFIPIFVLLHIMILLSIVLGVVVVYLFLKIKQEDGLNSRKSRKTSENWLLSRNQRNSINSELDMYGYMKPSVPLHNVKYTEVIEDINESLLSSLNPEVDLHNSRNAIASNTQRCILTQSFLQNGEANHVYEEIQYVDNSTRRLPQYLDQPYGRVNK